MTVKKADLPRVKDKQIFKGEWPCRSGHRGF